MVKDALLYLASIAIALICGALLGDVASFTFGAMAAAIGFALIVARMGRTHI